LKTIRKRFKCLRCGRLLKRYGNFWLDTTFDRQTLLYYQCPDCELNWTITAYDFKHRREFVFQKRYVRTKP
jgi:DNA-directed RNA polymerase subunit RPC12/RpoP